MANSDRVVLRSGIIGLVAAHADQPPAAMNINEEEKPMWLYYSQFHKTYHTMKPLVAAYVAQHGPLSKFEEGMICDGLDRICPSPPSFAHLRPRDLRTAELFLEMGRQYIRDHNDEQMERKGMIEGQFVFMFPHGRTADSAMDIVKRSWIGKSGLFPSHST